MWVMATNMGSSVQNLPMMSAVLVYFVCLVLIFILGCCFYLSRLRHGKPLGLECSLPFTMLKKYSAALGKEIYYKSGFSCFSCLYISENFAGVVLFGAIVSKEPQLILARWGIANLRYLLHINELISPPSILVYFKYFFLCLQRLIATLIPDFLLLGGLAISQNYLVVVEAH